MTQELGFPFRLDNTFFTSLRFHRPPQIPESLEVGFSVQAKVHADEFPDRLQVDLKIETPDDQPLTLSLELVGIFRAVEGQPEPEPSIIPDFINERALHMLWPYMAQMVRQVTGQMGMAPLNIPTPYMFQFQPSK
jgi:preprotein translocase subunit SecB